VQDYEWYQQQPKGFHNGEHNATQFNYQAISTFCLGVLLNPDLHLGMLLQMDWAQLVQFHGVLETTIADHQYSDKVLLLDCISRGRFECSSI